MSDGKTFNRESIMRQIAEAAGAGGPRKKTGTPITVGNIDEMAAPHKSPAIASAIRRVRDVGKALSAAQAEFDAARDALLQIILGEAEGEGEE